MTATGLRDQFCRRINYLRVSVTDRCNLRCSYCMPPEGVEPLGHCQILTYEEILRVVRIAVDLGITKVRLTGGEPLVRRGIGGLVAGIAAMRGVEDLSLTTNGTLLGPMAAELKNSGLKRVNISLDTLKPVIFEKITNRPGLESVLAGITAAKTVGMSPIKINTVAIRGVNDGEILDFARFAQEMGIEVRFIEHMPSRREVWDDASLVSAEEILGTIGAKFPLEELDREVSHAGPGRIFSLPGGGRVGVISPLSDHFCGSCNRLRLTADGRLRSCLFSNDELDLKTRLRDGSDDTVVASLLNTAVRNKPERHGLEGEENGHSGMDMSRIGG